MYYAGIGSRETPEEVINFFISIAKYLSKKEIILRSGHADGADMAFEIGCDEANGAKEIYLPWNGFNSSNSKLIVKDSKAFEIAEKFHPYWQNLKEGAKKLQARNTHQVLGLDFNTPSGFIICWTKGGNKVGGTAQAIRIAEYYNIPIYNAGKYANIDEMKKKLKSFFEDIKLI